MLKTAMHTDTKKHEKNGLVVDKALKQCAQTAQQLL